MYWGWILIITLSSFAKPITTQCELELHDLAFLDADEMEQKVPNAPVSRVVFRHGKKVKMAFPHAHYAIGTEPPVLNGIEKPSFVYDVSGLRQPLGPSSTYEGTTYGAASIQEAIRRYLPHKDFQDGTLDLFLPIREADLDPEMDLQNMVHIVNSFGAKGRAIRGMEKNTEAKRNIRIFVVGSPEQIGQEVPVNVLETAHQIRLKFGVEVAVTNRFAKVGDSGQLDFHSKKPGWIVLTKIVD